MDKVKELLTEEKMDEAIYVTGKEFRDANIKVLTKEVVAATKEALGEIEGVNVEKDAVKAVDKVLKKFQQKQILKSERRVDGRKLNETRPISCEVGVLPELMAAPCLPAAKPRL